MRTRILIVDDHPANLKLAAEVLRVDGFDVVTARDAIEALARLRDGPPALILTDIAMPGMDGLTFTRHLKATSGTRGVPVVALTASAMKGDESRMRAAGCDGYISKPIDTRRFGRQVAAFLNREPGTPPAPPTPVA